MCRQLSRSQNQARELIKSQKAKYADATHVVHAFIIGTSAEIMGMSDDGEPSGTAGRPALDVLKGRKCTNLVLTVTRWFGGTLLGTGGLVKAYSGGAKQVIEKADSLGVFHQFVKKQDFPRCNDAAFFCRMQRALFAFRRKTIKNNLGAFMNSSEKAEIALQKAGIDPKLRAETLKIDDLLRLSDVAGELM